MLLGFRIVGAGAIALLLSGCDWPIDPAPDVIYLISEDFSGWMCVDFEMENAPALPREGKAMVVRPRAGEVLETSDKRPGWCSEVWVEVGPERRPLPKDVRSRHEMSATGPNEPFQRVCRFVGTIDQEDAAGNPPGLDYGWFKTRPVPESERAALIALFEATGGQQWKHKVGWLGPAGTECNWHGVDCEPKYNESTTNVTRLDLHDNNLRGTVPEAFGDLPHLTWLAMGGESNVSGKLPAPLLRRWLSAELEVMGGPGSLFADISAIEIEIVSPDFSWCGGRSMVLRPDGSASSVAERCGRLVPLSLRKHCELKTGWFYVSGFRAAGAHHRAVVVLLTEGRVRARGHGPIARDHARDPQQPNTPGQQLRVRGTAGAVDDPSGHPWCRQQPTRRHSQSAPRRIQDRRRTSRQGCSRVDTTVSTRGSPPAETGVRRLRDRT